MTTIFPAAFRRDRIDDDVVRRGITRPTELWARQLRISTRLLDWLVGCLTCGLFAGYLLDPLVASVRCLLLG